MKKEFFISILLFFVFSMTSKSQELGFRFGDISGGNVAVDGIFSTGKLTRIHADLSFGNNGVGVEALWDFINNPLGGEAFNWYAGVGPYTYIGDNTFNLGAVGELGIEYHFREVPIALGFDWRPYVQLVEDTGIGVSGFGLNVRYVF
jgi:hypothetical protein